MSKLLLPDWVARRRANQELTELLKITAVTEEEQKKRLTRLDHRQAHKSKLKAQRRRQNKNAKQARKRNRVKS